ncbi:MAG TPA: ABC transporter ATP-binding protein [Gammaproteobacteria bacterium]|nr:ABC transporter ATP-binding protein [Gammaproteobacteria bacterium]
MAPPLVLERVSRHYGRGARRVTALREVSLQLGAGEFLAVLGPSGSGKSTLLNICGLLDRPDGGRCLLGGRPVQGLDENARCAWRRRHIGFVFQRHHLIPHMTVYENVAYPLYLQGVPRREMRARALAMLAAIGLSARRHHLPGRLSGGEQQRVGVARALVKRPLLVVADEPSASLDHASARDVLRLMRELNAELGASFLIASHDPFVSSHCDRRLSLLDGRLESDG